MVAQSKDMVYQCGDVVAQCEDVVAQCEDVAACCILKASSKPTVAQLPASMHLVLCQHWSGEDLPPWCFPR